ncbi:MAG: hypothetical protein GBAus27B_000276 [Mycoplasmataceae bacterium]|nr:MAG: hypothetical protein GBAus27B_000276 [Mycoplasmataceae bacterium]
MSDNNNENNLSFKEKVEAYTIAGSLTLLGISWVLMFAPTLLNSWKYQNNPHNQI